VLSLVSERKPPVVHAPNDERTGDTKYLAGGVGREFPVERSDNDAAMVQHDFRQFADQLEHQAFKLHGGRTLAGPALELSCQGLRLPAAAVTDVFEFRRQRHAEPLNQHLK
jgi:hypothetical protein